MNIYEPGTIRQIFFPVGF